MLLSAMAVAACVPSTQTRYPPRASAKLPPRAPVAARPVPPPVRTDPSRGRPSPNLVAALADIWRGFPGKTGIAVTRIDGDWTIGHRVGEWFPQQSVSKLWVAFTILDMVDRGEVRLDETLTITVNDLAVFHQPIRERVVREGEVRESVAALLELALTKSDNTANDVLLKRAGGPAAVRAFLARKGLSTIRFGPGERLLQSQIAGLAWNQDMALGRRFYAARAELPQATRQTALARYLADPVDGAAPDGITTALAKLARGELLQPGTARLAQDILARTSSGPQRLKAGVPPGWRFLHKTGTGQILGNTATGYNDVGIMTAPDGTRYAVAVMIGETTASVPQRMAMMQSVSRAVAQWHGQ